MSSKQAVVLIDGIGEQKPMDTLRGFIDTVWSRNKDIHHDYAGSDTWSKPDSVSESFELRRITTPQNSAEITTDFFEFYWAHLMHGTSYGHVLAWARMLLLRHPATVPPQLKSIYWILVVMAVIAAALGSYAAISYANDRELSGSSLLSTFGSLVLLPVAGFIFRSVVGDAPRYLHAAPTNIQRRHEVRQAGVKLLKALHDRGYERIILVGHSLGSVIGYDILTYGWVDYHLGRTAGATEMVALEEVERLAQGEMLESEVENIQRAQRAYFEELKINGNSWRVTDFVTLGSPLAHAAILLARNEDELKRKQADREFPTCLPWMETVTRNKQPVKRFSFELDSGKLYRVPHHAAPFAATRWTNLYFPCQNVLWGDLIGGKLREAMGFGVRDVPVFTKQRKGFLAHTLYWEYGKEADAPEHIKALRNALDLTDSRGCL